MKNLPLRWKLTLSTACLASLVLVGVGVGVSWHLHHDGVADIDRELREVSRGFFSELEHRHHEVDWNDFAAVDSLFPAVTSMYRIEIVDRGQVVYRSRNLGAEQFPSLNGRHAFATVARPEARMRVAEVSNDDVSLHLATNIHYIEETWVDLLDSFLIAAPVAMLLIGAGAWWIAGRALAPVSEITAAAEHITAQRLDSRLPMPGTKGDEIERLTLVLNQMIDRLEGSFLQATRFTADASHELKTPLTVIRGEIEAALRAGDLTQSQEKLLLNLLEETTRLVTITEDLLLLSRADAGKLRLETSPIDLSSYLDEMIEDVEILAERRSIKIHTEIPRDIFVRADEHFLRQLLLNLFDNAVKYNHVGGQLRVRIIAGRTVHQIAIANTGPGLTAEQAAHVFDRFYRGNAARDRSIGGHGLGLSICREIARALDGEISVHIEEPDWTEFRASLPKGQSPFGEPLETVAGDEAVAGLSSARS
jgi:signal transduction histidine kinase